MTQNQQKSQFKCTNCGNGIRELYKKYSNSVKTVHCVKCHKIADKYIEFESVIILVDAMLLSEKAYRHMLYNADFKLHWKLSLVLLLLESFALWRKKRSDNAESQSQYELVHEKAFYICCLQNILDYLVTTILLLLLTMLLRWQLLIRYGVRKYITTLLKSVAIANFSKFFLLPIMVWRDNTTQLGANIHHLLVTAHHLCALIYIFGVVFVGSRLGRLPAAIIVLSTYLVKEFGNKYISICMEQHI